MGGFWQRTRLRGRVVGMGFCWRVGWLGAALLLAGVTPAAGAEEAGGAQAGGAQPGRTRAACDVDRSAPSEADLALWARKYDDAELLYAAALKSDPADGRAMAGLVRTALRQDKDDEALALAKQYQAAYPKDADVLDALGEVRLRRGEVGEASVALDAAARLGPCDGRIHFDAARFLNLYGMYASAQQRLDFAHELMPNDAEITRRWQATQARPMTAQEQLAWLKEQLDHPKTPLTDSDKEAIEAAMKGIATREQGSCELVTPVTEARLPLVAMAGGVGLDVLINGKRKRLLVDTGASGLLLSRAAARAAGLVPELETTALGFGDEGEKKAFVTHVDDIRVGAMEFKNCTVQVLEQRGGLDMDGLMGPDMFRDFVVTLDFPARELRLGPLPKRPGEQGTEAKTLRAAEAEAGGDEGRASGAERAEDRYTAPEMKDWTPVFRAGHWLIFPTRIGNAPVKLFAMDSGAASSMISPAAAREVTLVTPDRQTEVRGISGGVGRVSVADHVTLTFAGVRTETRGMTSFDSTVLSRAAGVEVSGFIGFETLSHLAISIDYRDNLVRVVYDPKMEMGAH